MKIGILSDTHGHLQRTTQAIDLLASHNIDVVCAIAAISGPGPSSMPWTKSSGPMKFRSTPSSEMSITTIVP